MNIGDLFWAFRGTGTQLQKDAAREGDKAGQTLGQRMSAGLKKSWSGGEIGKGLVQGLGLAGGLGAARLFSGAISKVGDVLNDATQAALAEELSIQKLGSALKANVPNWNGETAGIEKVLKSRMALGFSDDEQRESLALLVVATKDANKALDIQRTAMDLARLKGISLAEASSALIKVENGQFRALKALGIQLKAGATATDALAAVQKAAAGQAEDYANTNAGKLLVSQVKVGEAMEKLGTKTLPLLTTATVVAADAVTVLATGFDVLGGKMPKSADEVHEATDALRDMSGALSTLFPQLSLLSKAADETDKNLETSMRGSVQSVENLRGAAADDLSGVVTSIEGVEDASGDMAGSIKSDNKAVIVSFQDLRDALRKTADDMVDDVFDPLITADNLRANSAEIAAERAIIASAKSTAAEKRDARDKLHQLEKDNAQYLIELAEAGATNTKAYADGIKELKKQIAAAKGPAKAALQEILNKILEIEAHADINVKVRVSSKTTSGLGPGGKVAGGPVRKGVPYIVGERRAEVFVPEVNGRIIPRVPASMAAVAGGGSGGDTYNTNLALYGRPLEIEGPADVVRETRRAQRLGLPPRRKPPRWKS